MKIMPDKIKNTKQRKRRELAWKPDKSQTKTVKFKLKKSEPEWKPDKSQILTIKESLAKKEKEKQEKEK